MSGREDPARDARLEAALRHAPDRDTAVPPLLRARIVAAAQREAEVLRRRRPWWRRLDAGWTPWRMGGAGTFAAAALAATVLWVGRDERPDAPDPRPTATEHGQRASETEPPSSPPRPTSQSAAPGSSTEPVATSAAPSPPVDAAPSAGRAVRDAGRREPPEARPAPAPGSRAALTAPASPATRNDMDGRSAATTTSRSEAASRVQESRASPARVEQDKLSAEKEEIARRARTERARQSAAVAAPPISPPPPAVAEPPAPFADAPAAGAASPGARAAPAAPSVTGAPPSARLVSPASRPASEASAAVVAAAAAAAGSTGAARRHALGSAADAVRELMVERWLSSADAAAAWRRRAPGGEEATVASGWIPEFDAATRGRWVAAPARDAAGEAWTLMPPGGRQARLFWVPGAVIVCDLVAGRCEQARLEAATLESLRLGLAR